MSDPAATTSAAAAEPRDDAPPVSHLQLGPEGTSADANAGMDTRTNVRKSVSFPFRMEAENPNL